MRLIYISCFRSDVFFFFFSSRRRHTRWPRDWSSDVCSSDLTDRLAELVCTNSFKSEELTNAHGLLKSEMRALGSILLESALEAREIGRASCREGLYKC